MRFIRNRPDFFAENKRHKPMKKETTTKKGNANAVTPITNLSEVLKIIETPVQAQFELDGRPVQIAVRRALPAVMEKRRALLRAPQPPYVKERNDYDQLNPQYLRQRDEAILQARSLTVYLCCPELAALKPGLTEPAQIHAAIGALLPETILELLELTAISGGLDVEVARRANFSLAAPLEN
jgi:hypothetical protein